MSNKNDINAERSDAEWYAMGTENRISDLKNKVEKNDLTQAHNNEMSLKNQDIMQKNLDRVEESMSEIKVQLGTIVKDVAGMISNSIKDVVLMMKEGDTKDSAAISVIKKDVELHKKVLWVACGFILCLSVCLGFVLNAAAKLLEIRGHL